ncbi:hypothetical protein R1A27_04975 [Methylobacterium sp. NMS12]|uniref:hypothetical protein n=1 Tax=Methylobacterium sp. NMS12 TaxID=3079766 RepID=UPI003F8811EB
MAMTAAIFGRILIFDSRNTVLLPLNGNDGWLSDLSSLRLVLGRKNDPNELVESSHGISTSRFRFVLYAGQWPIISII